jgi:CRISP-associated protein Cas1
MFFRKKTDAANHNRAADIESAPPSLQTRATTAHTAHLVGPGCVKLKADLPIWRPITGAATQLHPQYLKAIICYGNVDFSTATLHQLWQHGVQVVFLSPAGHRLLGRLQPMGGAPNLPRLQHLAASDPRFALGIAKTIVAEKLQSTCQSIRYYQQQGKGTESGRVRTQLKSLLQSAENAIRVESLRGIEGTAARIWFEFFRALLPTEWPFKERVAYPPTDPVNSLLSLGYTMALARCQQLLAASDLDPLVGFLHEIRSGRPSLACDMVEPLRVQMVDRWILSMLHRRQFSERSFQSDQNGFRLVTDAYKEFIGGFEKQFLAPNGREPSFRDQTLTRIDSLAALLRETRS